MIKLALLILLFSSTPPALQTEAGSVGDQLKQIDSLIEQGRLEVALSRLSALEQRNPENAEVYVRIGEIYFTQEEHFSALESLRRALELQPGHKRATQYLGTSLYSLGRLQEAIPYLEQSLNWFPDNVNFLNILALCYVQTERPEKAREIFSRIFDIPMDSPQAHLLTGQMLRQQDIWKHAETELKRALELNPQIPMARLYLGEMLFAQRKLAEAMTEFQKEIELNPGMWMAYYRTGEVLFEMGRIEDAVPYLQQSIWLNKFFAGPYLLLGQIHLRQNRLGLALENLGLAVQFDYTNPNTHYLFGRALSQAGRLEEAQREFDLSKQFRERK